MTEGVNNVGGAGKNQQPIQAYEGISVDKIKKEGTKADARSINIYDTNNDGQLTGDEVSTFNNTKRTLSADGKKLSIFNNQDGKNQRIDITSSNEVLDDQLHFDKNGNFVQEGDLPVSMELSDDGISFTQMNNNYVQKNGEKLYNYINARIQFGDKTHVDLNIDKNSLSVSNAKGTTNYIYASNTDINVKNSEINTINMSGGTLNADGVNDRTLIFDTDTEVITDGNTTINQKNSSLNIKKEKD